MATQVKHRRGTQSEIDAFTGAIGEIVVNTTEDELVLNNGATQGGVPIAKKRNTMLSFDTLDAVVTNTSLKAGYAIELKERTAGKGGGGTWDVVLASTVTPNTFNIVQCTGVATLALVLRTTGTSTVAQFGAVGDNVTDDTAAIQECIIRSSVVIFDRSTYRVEGSILVDRPKIINLNGAIVNAQYTSQIPCFNVQSDLVEIFGGTITVTGTVMGGAGSSLACITAGNQGDGTGFDNLSFTDLTLSTNRNDAGAAISILGECTNILVENIVIPDNNNMRNVFGFEWGGLPVPGGTGHPHNIKVNNIKVGRLNNVSPMLGGYGYIVWASAAFNVEVSNIFVERAYGILCHIQGDNGADYAPARYQDLVGKNVSLVNGSIKECYGYAVRVVGRPTDDDFGAYTTVDGLVAYGDLTAGNNAIGMANEYCTNVILRNFKLSGFYTGYAVGSASVRPVVENGEVTLSQSTGVNFGNPVKCIEPTISNVLLHKNNQAAFSGTGVAGVLLNNSIRATIENCVFGVSGEADTTKYAVAADVSCVQPELNNNYVHELTVDGVAYLFGASTQTEILPHGVNNYADPGVNIIYGGCPIFQIDTLGVKRFTSSAIPVGGAYEHGDRVYFSAPTTFIGAVCTVSGSPGTWKTFGAITP